MKSLRINQLITHRVSLSNIIELLSKYSEENGAGEVTEIDRVELKDLSVEIGAGGKCFLQNDAGQMLGVDKGQIREYHICPYCYSCGFIDDLKHQGDDTKCEKYNELANK